MANRFSDQIEQLLAPLVGEFIAKMAVKSQCKALGITPEQISAQHLPGLATRIGQALAFYGKKEETQAIVTKINAMR